MDIKQCFEILELKPNASIQEVRQAYRDIVTVWHPDRFGNNPRLIQKAEEKLKEVNEAYETLSFLLSIEGGAETWKTTRGAAANRGTSGAWRSEQRSYRKENWRDPDNAFSSRTEAVAEAGTRFLLAASSQLMKMFLRWIDTDKE